MPEHMFQEVVSPHAQARGHWCTLPLSFVVHAIVLALLVVAPLVAADVLPMPRAALLFIDDSVIPAVAAPPPAASRRDMPTPAIAPSAGGAPLTAPDTVGQETGVTFQQDPIDTQTLDGIVGGLGALPGATIEAAPLVSVDAAPPVRTGGAIRPPERTRYVAPEYPEIARRSGVEGIVIIEAIIGVDGRVEAAKILRSSPLLDSAALAAVRAWEYTPTLLNGRPTAVIMTVTVRFDLK